jgi:hypothetical protein
VISISLTDQQRLKDWLSVSRGKIQTSAKNHSKTWLHSILQHLAGGLLKIDTCSSCDNYCVSDVGLGHPLLARWEVASCDIR